MTIPEIDFPSSDSDFIKDPYPLMKDLREMSPVVLDKTTDLQLVTRFDGVKNIQTRIFKQVKTFHLVHPMI